MIISCPKCSSGFFVSPAQIGATGRRVKCSKCKNIWHATIPSENFLSQQILAERIDHQVQVAGSNLPAVIPIKISKILWAAPGFLTFLILATLWMFFPNVTSKIGLCGSMCIDDGIRIENVKHSYNQLNQSVILEYNIANRTSEKQKIPLVELKLFDKTGALLRKAYTENSGIELVPNSTIKGKAQFDMISPNAQKVAISLGSRLKFWLR